MTGARQWMVAKTSPQELQSRFAVRHPVPDDALALGLLLYDAYVGTVDDAGEGPDDAIAEVRSVFEGAHGIPILEASFLVIDNNKPISLSFITEFKGTPLLAFCATAKAHQRRCLASDLIRRSLDALATLGRDRLRLIVTRANRPAIRLYHTLGFVAEDEDA